MPQTDCSPSVGTNPLHSTAATSGSAVPTVEGDIFCQCGPDCSIQPLCPAATSSGAIAVTESDWILGLGASALSGLSSAYAGVYFEKYVKGKMSGTLWVRNLQLGIYGLPLSIAYMLVKDWRSLQIGGIMQVSQYKVAGLM